MRLFEERVELPLIHPSRFEIAKFGDSRLLRSEGYETQGAANGYGQYDGTKRPQSRSTTWSLTRESAQWFQPWSHAPKLAFMCAPSAALAACVGGGPAATRRCPASVMHFTLP